MHKLIKINLVLWVTSALCACYDGNSSSPGTNTITIQSDAAALSDVMMGDHFQFTASISGNNVNPQTLTVIGTHGETISSKPSPCILATNDSNSTSCVFTVQTEWNTSLANTQLLSYQVSLTSSGPAQFNQSNIQYTLETPSVYLAQTGASPTETVITGVAWPPMDQRFTVDGQCVTDNLTGLMWLQSPPTSHSYTWDPTAQNTNSVQYYINQLDQSGVTCGAGVTYSDWRLPDLNELYSLIDYTASPGPSTYLNDDIFSNISSAYWSSNPYALSNSSSVCSGTVCAWHMGMGHGNFHADAINIFFAGVWAVRGNVQ